MSLSDTYQLHIYYHTAKLCQEHSISTVITRIFFYCDYLLPVPQNSALVSVDTGSCPVSSAPSPALSLTTTCVCAAALHPHLRTLALLHLCHWVRQKLCRSDTGDRGSLEDSAWIGGLWAAQWYISCLVYFGQVRWSPEVQWQVGDHFDVISCNRHKNQPRYISGGQSECSDNIKCAQWIQRVGLRG